MFKENQPERYIQIYEHVTVPSVHHIHDPSTFHQINNHVHFFTKRNLVIIENFVTKLLLLLSYLLLLYTNFYYLLFILIGIFDALVLMI